MFKPSLGAFLASDRPSLCCSSLSWAPASQSMSSTVCTGSAELCFVSDEGKALSSVVGFSVGKMYSETACREYRIKFIYNQVLYALK